MKKRMLLILSCVLVLSFACQLVNPSQPEIEDTAIPTDSPEPLPTTAPTELPEPTSEPTDIPQPSPTPTDIPAPTPTSEPTTMPVSIRVRMDDNPNGQVNIDVLEGDYQIKSGTTFRQGSKIWLEEQYLIFPVGLAIEVGPAGLTLRGAIYPEGALLYVEVKDQIKEITGDHPEAAQPTTAPVGEAGECEFDDGTQREYYSLSSPYISHPVQVDGEISSPDEWAGASCVELRLHQGLDVNSTNSRRVRWWVQNDDENLYFLIRVPLKEDVAGVYVNYFWPRYTGVWEHSDGLYVKVDGEQFDHGQWDERNWYDDTELDPPGTFDLDAAVSEDDEYYWIEMKRDLVSGDQYDWAFEMGQEVGYNPDDSFITGIVLTEGFYNRNLQMSIGAP